MASWRSMLKFPLVFHSPFTISEHVANLLATITNPSSTAQALRIVFAATGEVTNGVVSAEKIGGTDAEEVPATSIALSANTLSFADSASKTLIATVEPVNSTDAVAWSSSKPEIAEVSKDGNMDGVAGDNSVLRTVVIAGEHGDFNPYGYTMLEKYSQMKSTATVETFNSIICFGDSLTGNQSKYYPVKLRDLVPNNAVVHQCGWGGYKSDTIYQNMIPVPAGIREKLAVWLDCMTDETQVDMEYETGEHSELSLSMDLDELEKLTLPQLHALAKSVGVEYTDATTAADLVAKLATEHITAVI